MSRETHNRRTFPMVGLVSLLAVLALAFAWQGAKAQELRPTEIDVTISDQSGAPGAIVASSPGGPPVAPPPIRFCRQLQPLRAFVHVSEVVPVPPGPGVAGAFQLTLTGPSNHGIGGATDNTGAALLNLPGLELGTYTLQADFLMTPTHSGSRAIGSFDIIDCVSPPPAFSRPIVSLFPGVPFVTCIQGQFEEPRSFPHYWFVHPRQSGQLTIDVRAVAANVLQESGSITARLIQGPTLLGQVTVNHPTGAGASDGDENVGLITFEATASHRYRLEVTRGAPTRENTRDAHHYKLSFFGLPVDVGVNSPTFKYLEGVTQIFRLNVDQGEDLRLRLFADPGQASSITVEVRDGSGNVLYSASNQSLPHMVAIDDLAADTLAVEVSANGHYRMGKVSGSDQGIYFETCLRPPPPPPPGRVKVDIKPGSDPNSINLKSQGLVSVAIFTIRPEEANAQFGPLDATKLDPANIRIMDAADFDPTNPARRFPNGAAPERSSLEDVDGDGDLDLVLKFSTQDLIADGLFDANTTEARIYGPALPGPPPVGIRGSDAVRIVGD